MNKAICARTYTNSSADLPIRSAILFDILRPSGSSAGGFSSSSDVSDVPESSFGGLFGLLGVLGLFRGLVLFRDLGLFERVTVFLTLP